MTDCAAPLFSSPRPPTASRRHLDNPRLARLLAAIVRLQLARAVVNHAVTFLVYEQIIALLASR